MDFINIVEAILGIGFSLIAGLLRIVFAFIAGMIAVFKGRNFLLWGAGTLFFPWVIFIIIFMPRKQPRFRSYISEKEEFRGKNPVIASILALSAIVAKSDGNVTKEEISIIKRFISSHFGISRQELNTYGSVFEYGKNNPHEYKEFTRIITTYYRRRDIIIAIAYLLVSIAMQDGQVSDKEDIQIRDILSELGLSEYEYNSIKNSFTQGRTQYNRQNTRGYAQNQQSLIKKYSKVLGIDEDASLSEAKKAYRKLVKEYHPDKAASKGMPEEYVEFANKKVSEINEAYDYLKKVKGA